MRRCVFYFVLLATLARPALAQDRPVHRIEAALGGSWLSGSPAGTATAALRANQTSASAMFTVFRTNSQFGSAPGVEARVGFSLTRAFTVETNAAFMRPKLRTRISNDVENAPALTAVESVDQYFFDAALVWHLDALRLGERTVPFVSGGAGYLRQLHEGRTLIETGQVYHVGGGIKHWLLTRDRGFLRAAGVRADAGVYVLAKGIDLEDRPRPHGTVSASFFVAF